MQSLRLPLNNQAIQYLHTCISNYTSKLSSVNAGRHLSDMLKDSANLDRRHGVHVEASSHVLGTMRNMGFS